MLCATVRRYYSQMVVGLGNPGAEYALTRHNIGSRVVRHLAKQNGLVFRKNRKCLFANKIYNNNDKDLNESITSSELNKKIYNNLPLDYKELQDYLRNRNYNINLLEKNINNLFTIIYNVYKNILGFSMNQESTDTVAFSGGNMGVNINLMKHYSEAVLFELLKSVDFNVLWGNSALNIQGYYQNSEIIVTYADLDPVSGTTDYATKSPTVVIQDFISLQTLSYTISNGLNTVNKSVLPPQAFFALKQASSQTSVKSTMAYIKENLGYTFDVSPDLESLGTEEGNSNPTGRNIAWDDREKDRILFAYLKVADPYAPVQMEQNSINYGYRNEISNILLPRPYVNLYQDGVSTTV